MGAMPSPHLAASLFDIDNGQGARQFAELAIALLLSSLIGLEREVRQKSAGLRTHTLVGVGSALFMEVSIHGFGALLGADGVSLDPSRVAAQIVSGIGFIGGGLIFVKKDAVRGLTTAATIWLTCAIGMACGGGLPLLAAGATTVHFLIVRGFPLLSDRVRPSREVETIELRLSYRPRKGLLGQALEMCARDGFHVTDIQVDNASAEQISYRALLRLEGRGSVHPLVEELSELDGVRGITLDREPDRTE